MRPGHAGLMAASLPDLRLDLDRPAPADLHALFPVDIRQVWLEIGFGGGEHLTQRAGENPDVGFIGCEAYVNGTAKMLAQIEQNGLANVRLWDEDAKRVVEWLPPASIDRLYLLYPDPWPKRRHRKRRFLGEEMLARLARILKPGAELRFATDIDDYAAYALARVARSADFVWTAERQADWLTPWEGWRSTRYEAKALREGRRGAYFTFRRV
nr:tRNA (guanosine(46)-N7)-methyltransferase TrmB [Labrys monachus]